MMQATHRIATRYTLFTLLLILIVLLKANHKPVGATAARGSSVPCPSSLTVNNPGDTADALPGDDLCADAGGQCTLRAAIMEANALANCSPLTLNFSVTGTINLATALPDLNHPNLTIDGPGAAQLTIARNSASAFRIFTIAASKTVAINGLTIRNGNDTSGNGGGGILNNGTLSITNCVVTSNQSSQSGGGINSLGALTLTDSTLSANQAGSTGGGVAFFNHDGTFTGCSFISNIALQGGGIQYQGNYGHTLMLANCTISGNQTSGAQVGGIAHNSFAGSSTVRMTNCTLNNNTMGTIGTFAGNASTATTYVRNSIVVNDGSVLVGNTGGGVAQIVSLGNNMFYYLSGPDPGPGDIPVYQNELLAPLGNYGGSTQTHALLPGSPAINAGAATGAPTADQRGIARVGQVDIGAFESQGFTLAISGGNNQSTPGGAVLANPLAVTVSSSFSEPVNGGSVSFTSPNSGPSALFSPDFFSAYFKQSMINASGQAVVTATANMLPGTYQVTAAANGANTVAFNLSNTCPAITVNPASTVLPAGRSGTFYSQSFSPTGGVGTVNFGISAGALPAGLTLSTFGTLSGTPTVFGAFNFTVRATDANNCFGERAYSLTIHPPCTTATLNPASLPGGFQGLTYNQTLTVTGGGAPYSFALTPGDSLPNGLSLSGGGVLTGTPTASGSFSFTVRATDNTGCTVTRSYTLIVSGNGLMFYPLPAPVRLLDTRTGASPSACSQPNAQITGNTSRTQPARNFCGLPANAQAITGNVTTVQSGGGYLTLYPSDATQPLVTNSNYNPNEILNNAFTVGLGASDGAFNIFVTSDTDVVIDVTGYYAPPGAGGLYFHPLPKPVRLLETRPSFSGPCGSAATPLSGGADYTQLAIPSCVGTIPSTARAITGNATTINSGGGYLTLFPANVARPVVANSNYLPGQIMNAPFTVGLSPAGEFKIYPTTQTDLVIDVLGYYSAEASDANGIGLLFNPLPRPVRLLETRSGLTGCDAPGAPLLAGSIRTQPARGVCDGVTIADNALGLVGNATVVNAAAGYLTFWPGTTTLPLAAASNFSAGQVLNRHFTVGLDSADGAFKIYTQSQTDLVIDVSGYFAP